MRAAQFLVIASVLVLSGCGAAASPGPQPSANPPSSTEKPPAVTVEKGRTGEVAVKVGDVISVPPNDTVPLVKDPHVRLDLQTETEWRYRAASPGRTVIPTNNDGASVTLVIS
ncbi:hypothetical protein [Allokutzneria oryzae]|uniref:Uncharacterized protein n=1 Tax=Allokutzneria oryzae TaxID=1378989 RepID=A0ABV5ZVE4_9PSEU